MKRFFAIFGFALALFTSAFAQTPYGYEYYLVQFNSDATGADYTLIEVPKDTVPGDVDGVLGWDSTAKKTVGFQLDPIFVFNKTTRVISIDATQINYNDLAGKPTLGSAAAQSSSAFATAAQGTTADNAQPLIAAGSSGQFYAWDKTWKNWVQADWNASSGPSAIQNKPSIPSGTVVSVGVSSTDLSVSGSPVTVNSSITLNLNTTGVSADTYANVTVDSKGRVTGGTKRSFRNGLSNTLLTSIVSTAAAANGTQQDSSRDVWVSYSGTITSTSTLTGGGAGVLVLEICSTNSSIAANWIEIARTADGQNNALIVGLSLAQVGGGTVSGMVPGGFYVRVRSINSVGTPSYTLNSGQEVLQ